MAYWLGAGSPVRLTEFDSPHSLQFVGPEWLKWKSAALVTRRSGFRIPPLAPSGKSSAWFERSIDNREAAGSTPASRTKFQCGQVNRRHAGLISHASGVQLASPQPVSWGSRSMGGPLACNQPMRVRFPPLPPIRVGVAQWDESAGFRSPRPLVRFQPLTPVFFKFGD